ncbi:hypothetical protein [Enterococcus sp. UD-01]|jgi:ABC-type polysaccharide/polyol phosphate export permease|uniref:hypothetical protein n=1 Tax=Enterococcus sp. UD-01 TaxID=3373911 RepID=UPI0038325CF5
MFEDLVFDQEHSMMTILIKRNYPHIFQLIVCINPFTYVIDSLRNIITDNSVNWQSFSLSVGIMLVLTLFIGTITIKKLK